MTIGRLDIDMYPTWRLWALPLEVQWSGVMLFVQVFCVSFAMEWDR